MKRRSFGLLAGTSLIALKTGQARAQTADAGSLTTTLTPVGAERASNADGSIPAWTGGYTTVAPGWVSGDFVPCPFAADPLLVTINAANVDQYADKLSVATVAMIKKYGYFVKVYPTHRSAAAPQEVYDNIALNVSRASLVSAGGRFGFQNAFGGVPFPIPDLSDPDIAGTQIIWNHQARWQGYGLDGSGPCYAVSSGSVALATATRSRYDYPYYRKGGSLATYDGILYRILTNFTGPPNNVGEEAITVVFSNPYANPDETWELLAGQGRVRKAPEVSYDTPSSEANGIANYDEYFGGISGALDRYDWKYIGKKEVYIPYNTNDLQAATELDVHLPHFLDPAITRWELHRVWVIECTLHPGNRNVMARRTFYIDEDTWTIGLVETYDANNNLFHAGISYMMVRPEIPATLIQVETVHNLQTGDYASVSATWNQKVHPSMTYNDGYPNALFNPTTLAAAAQY